MRKESQEATYPESLAQPPACCTALSLRCLSFPFYKMEQYMPTYHTGVGVRIKHLMPACSRHDPQCWRLARSGVGVWFQKPGPVPRGEGAEIHLFHKSSFPGPAWQGLSIMPSLGEAGTGCNEWCYNVLPSPSGPTSLWPSLI